VGGGPPVRRLLAPAVLSSSGSPFERSVPASRFGAFDIERHPEDRDPAFTSMETASTPSMDSRSQNPDTGAQFSLGIDVGKPLSSSGCSTRRIGSCASASRTTSRDMWLSKRGFTIGGPSRRRPAYRWRPAEATKSPRRSLYPSRKINEPLEIAAGGTGTG